MTTFSAHTTAEAIVPVPRDRVWDVLIDPDLIAQLTPFVKSIKADGEHWIWTLSGFNVLGKGFSATFTERMTLEDGKRIEFAHDPPRGIKEPTSVNGWYNLADVEEGVRLETSMEIQVDMPLPKLAGGAVRTTMKGVLATMGDRFSKNLLTHLGVD